MQKAITMTSKGTFTLPAQVRKALGVTKAGDTLLLQYHERSKTVEIKNIPDLRAIQKQNAAIVKAKGIKPITDLGEVRAKMYTERWKRFQKQA